MYMYMHTCTPHLHEVNMYTHTYTQSRMYTQTHALTQAHKHVRTHTYMNADECGFRPH